MKKLSLNEMANIQAKGVSEAIDIGCGVFGTAGGIAAIAGVSVTGVGSVVVGVVGIGCVGKWAYDWFF